MRLGFAILALLVLPASAPKRDHRADFPQPSELVIARHTFWDFGPPLDFYELYFVRQEASGTSVQRISLTPVGIKCLVPAKVETKSAPIAEPISSLLKGANPCSIPEKDLRRESRRCKHCLVFSGAKVAMKVQCGNQSRLIHAEILDKDMFDPHANTPEHTSWTMDLLASLDSALGSSVLDKPMFAQPDDTPSAPGAADSSILQDISLGKYDSLFREAQDKVSDIFREAQNPPPPPTFELVRISPVTPENSSEIHYPPIARFFFLNGSSTFTFDITPDGVPTNLQFDPDDGGSLTIHRGVTYIAPQWRFPKTAAGLRVQATLRFTATCAPSATR